MKSIKEYPELTPNESGKAIRAELKSKFPNIKFSVKKDGANTYGVSWTDGPNSKEVENSIGRFRGKTFNFNTGMVENIEYIVEYNGQFYRSGVGYLFLKRTLSIEAKEQIWNSICLEWHLDSKEIPYGSDAFCAKTNPYDTHSYIQLFNLKSTDTSFLKNLSVTDVNLRLNAV
ncbi:LPD29 domain-containing protein [Leptospira noguchii]|uniref:LPD29 domain-containing protein n=1 Tax=Leptospira noguchii TaxID=28182 RepID=UPI000387A8AE|nr:LPD29 domain-containing protein [Leptospira noguchii]AGS80630.1 hypothetical protein LEP1GSC059_0022 [Leptospira phage vB_LnoZ_CZ214-LE1]